MGGVIERPKHSFIFMTGHQLQPEELRWRAFVNVFWFLPSPVCALCPFVLVVSRGFLLTSLVLFWFYASCTAWAWASPSLLSVPPVFCSPVHLEHRPELRCLSCLLSEWTEPASSQPVCPTALFPLPKTIPFHFWFPLFFELSYLTRV